MLLMRKRSQHSYLERFPSIENDEFGEKRKKRIRQKIFQLGDLIDILECVVNQMELQIIAL